MEAKKSDERIARDAEPAPPSDESVSFPYQAIMYSHPDPLAVLDGYGNLRYVNRAWRRLAVRHGLVDPHDEQSTNYISRLERSPSKDVRAWATQIQGLLDGATVSCEFDFEMAGQAFQARADAINELGHRWVVLAYNVPAQAVDVQDAEEKLVRIAMEREEVDSQTRRLEMLIEAFQKELNTPVTPIAIQMHLLRSGSLGKLDAKQSAALATIARNVDRWNRTCQTLALQLQPTPTAGPCDAVELGREILDVHATQALQQGTKLRWHGEEAALQVALGSDDVRRIVDTLILRALELSPAGATVLVGVYRHGDAARIEVSDAGPQLTITDAAALFDPKGVAEHPGRAGLVWLHAISQSIGGRAWCEPSGHDAGGVVYVELPLVGRTMS